MSSAGQAVIGIAGAVIGAITPIGWVIGLSIGLTVGGILFPSTPEVDSNPGKSLDLQIQTSQYGIPVKVVYGSRRLAGNVIWYDNFQKIEHTEETEVGGKGGGQTVSQTYYTYTVSLAVGVCMATSARTVVKIWAGKEQIYPYSTETIRLYDGTQTTSDSHIATFTTRDPIWKNLCYVVFENYNLGTSPNVPNFTFEVTEDPIITTPTFDSVLISGANVSSEFAISSSDDSADLYTWVGTDNVYKYNSGGTLSDTQTFSFPGNEIVLDDASSSTLKYLCFDTHRACTDTKPTSGANYAQHWQFTGSAVTRTWSAGQIFSKPAINNRPTQLAVNSDGTFRIASTTVFTSMEFASFGGAEDSTKRFGVQDNTYCTTGKKITSSIGELVTDSDGIAFSADSGTNIFVYLASHAGASQVDIGGTSGSGDGQFTSVPQGIGLTSTEVFVSDFGNDRVQVFDRTTGAFLREWGSSGSGDGQFNTPRGLAVDSHFVYVVDSSNVRVQIFNHSGTFITKFGDASKFTAPRKLRVTSSFVYVIDVTKKEITKWVKPDFISGDNTVPTDVSTDVLTNGLYGLGLASSYLNTTVFDATDTFCQNNDLYVSMLFEKQMSVLDVLQYIIQHHEGYISYMNGVISHGQLQQETPEGSIGTNTNDIINPKGSFPVKVATSGGREYVNKVWVEYTKADKDYVRGTALSDDMVDIDSFGVKNKSITLDGLTTFSRASQMADRILRKSLAKLETFAFKLGAKNITIQPGQVWSLTDSDLELSSQPVRLLALREGEDYNIEVLAQEENTNIYDWVSYGSDTSTQPTLPVLGGDPGSVINPQAVELPALYGGVTNQIAVAYSKSGNEQWAGATIYRAYSTGGSYVKLGAAAGGITGTVSGVGTSNYTKYIDVTLDSTDFTLTSATDFDDLITTANKNLFMVATSAGDKFVRFQNATLQSPGVWRLDGLVYDTVGFTNLNTYGDIAVNDKVAMYESLPFVDDLLSSDVDRTLYFKIASYNYRGALESLSDLTPITETISGLNDKPLPIYGVTVEGVAVDSDDEITISSGDIDLTWKVRNRYNSGASNFNRTDAIPEDGDFQDFIIEVWNDLGDATYTRRFAAQTGKSVTYTLSMQSIDSVTSPIYFKIRVNTSTHTSDDKVIKVNYV